VQQGSLKNFMPEISCNKMKEWQKKQQHLNTERLNIPASAGHYIV
jgi:hypothetical protein